MQFHMRFNLIIERAHPKLSDPVINGWAFCNWNILQLLQKDCKGKEHSTIISISLCGLHVLHEAFKVGMETAGRDVGKVLKLMWQLFHDSWSNDLVVKALDF